MQRNIHKPERKVVFGSLSFDSFKERIRLMNELYREFSKDLKITVEDNMLIYEYVSFE